MIWPLAVNTRNKLRSLACIRLIESSIQANGDSPWCVWFSAIPLCR